MKARQTKSKYAAKGGPHQTRSNRDVVDVERAEDGYRDINERSRCTWLQFIQAWKDSPCTRVVIEVMKPRIISITERENRKK